uniref:Uncharacterized protein n=1 Tax=Triticum urartu TaxID=4572 RepID=A0A8R7TDX1_TRIUA
PVVVSARRRRPWSPRARCLLFPEPPPTLISEQFLARTRRWRGFDPCVARVKSMGEIGGRTGVRFVRGSGEIGERACRLERGGLICACFGVKSVSELGARRFDLAAW